MAQHTPGPWFFSPSYGLNHRRNGEFIIQGSNDLGGGPVLPIMGRTHNFPDNAEANARLIAAAPDMLAALKLVSGFDIHHEVLRIVDAAILKAEGRS